MFIQHGDDYIAVTSIHRARWNSDAGSLSLKVGPIYELVYLTGKEARQAKETLDACVVRVALVGDEGAAGEGDDPEEPD